MKTMGTEHWCTAFLWIGALRFDQQFNNKSWGWCYQSVENKTCFITECEKGHRHTVRKLIKYEADVIIEWLIIRITTLIPATFGSEFLDELIVRGVIIAGGGITHQ